MERYGSRSDFLRTFHVSRQESYSRLPDRCYFGTAPTLQKVNEDYGDGLAQEWMLYELDDLSEYCGAHDKLTQFQIESLSQLLTKEYGWLNVAEWMLFFRRFKLGYYGRFYGAVDPMSITIALREKFLPERMTAYKRYAESLKMRERDEWERHSVTYEEYLQIVEARKKEKINDDGIQD